MKKTICLLAFAAAFVIAGGIIGVRVDTVTAGQGNGTDLQVGTQEELSDLVRSIPSASDYYSRINDGAVALSSAGEVAAADGNYDFSNLTVQTSDYYSMSADDNLISVRRSLNAYFTPDCVLYDGDISMITSTEAGTVYDDVHDRLLNCTVTTNIKETYSLYISADLVLVKFDNVEYSYDFRYETESGTQVNFTPEDDPVDSAERMLDAVLDDFKNNYGEWIRLNMDENDFPEWLSEGADLTEEQQTEAVVFMSAYTLSYTLVEQLVQVNDSNEMFIDDINNILNLDENCFDTSYGLSMLNDRGRQTVSLSNLTRNVKFIYDLTNPQAPEISCRDSYNVPEVGASFEYSQNVTFRYIGNTVVNVHEDRHYNTLYNVFGDTLRRIINEAAEQSL